MPATVASGKYAASGATTTTARARKIEEKTEASGVLAPASKFAALRLIDPAEGYDENTLPAMVAVIMKGTFFRWRFARTPDTIVNTPTLVTHGLMCPNWSTVWRSV